MKSVMVYNIMTYEGKSLPDVTLEMTEDYQWIDIFEKLSSMTLEDVDSYSSHEVEQQDRGFSSIGRARSF